MFCLLSRAMVLPLATVVLLAGCDTMARQKQTGTSMSSLKPDPEWRCGGLRFPWDQIRVTGVMRLQSRDITLLEVNGSTFAVDVGNCDMQGIPRGDGIPPPYGVPDDSHAALSLSRSPGLQ
jgi:hypothetical protein